MPAPALTAWCTEVRPYDRTKLICTAALWVSPLAARRSFFVRARKLAQKHTSLPVTTPSHQDTKPANERGAPSVRGGGRGEPPPPRAAPGRGRSCRPWTWGVASGASSLRGAAQPPLYTRSPIVFSRCLSCSVAVYHDCSVAVYHDCSVAVFLKRQSDYLSPRSWTRASGFRGKIHMTQKFD